MLQQLAEQPQEALTIRRGQPLPQDQKLAVAYGRGGRVWVDIEHLSLRWSASGTSPRLPQG
jgi:hypothetical protein